MKVFFTAGLCLFLLIACTTAQEIKKDNDVWFLLLNHVDLIDRWIVGNEFHWRLKDWVNDKEQLLIRPFVFFKINENFIPAFGYTFINTYNTVPAAQPKPEHNIWEQMTVVNHWERLTLSHRYRLEHRWIGSLITDDGERYKVDSYNLSHRFRYRLTATVPINKKWFLNIFDEIFVKTDNKFQYPNYDRNWLYVGLGYRFVPTGNVQLAFLHQTNRNNDLLYQINPSAQLTVQYDLK